MKKKKATQNQSESHPPEHSFWNVDPVYVTPPEELPVKRSLEGAVDLRSICDGIDESQPVELYDGTLGVSREFVMQHEGPVGQVQWNSDLRQKYEEPGNVAGIRWATGTLIARDLFLTAGHAFDRSPGSWRVPRKDGEPISSEEIARNMHINFNYQVDPSGDLRREVSFPILDLLEYRLGGLDYAIVRLGGNPGDQFGIAHISPKPSRNGDMLCIIQHPEGLPKRIEAGPQYHTHDHQIGYDSIDTLGGSSGAGILQASTGLLVGVHTNGGCHLNVIGHNHGVLLQAIADISSTIKRLLSPGWIHLDLHQVTEAPKAKSAPSFYVTKGSLHVLFRNNRGNIFELTRNEKWQSHPIDAASSIPHAKGDSTGYALFGNRTRYITFLGRDDHIHQLWNDGSWQHVDVSGEAGAPDAASEPAPHISYDGNSQQLYYCGCDGNVYLLWWGARWHHANLSAATAAAPAAGRPTVCSTHRDEHLYVAYTGADGHIHLLHRQGTTWQWIDLSEAALAPPAASDPVAVLLQGDVQPRLYYRTGNGRIIEIHWSGRWLYMDLTAASGAPPAKDHPSLAVAPDASFTTLLYRSRKGKIIQLEYRDGWQADDLSAKANAPEARSRPSGVILYPGSRLIVYRGKDDHIHEISWEI